MQPRGHGRLDRVSVGCAWEIKLATGGTQPFPLTQPIFITFGKGTRLGLKKF